MAMNKCTGEIFNCPALHPGKLPNRTCRGKNPRVLVMWNLISSWKRWCDATNCNSRVLGQIQDFLTVPSPPVPIQDRMQIRQTSSLPPHPPFCLRPAEMSSEGSQGGCEIHHSWSGHSWMTGEWHRAWVRGETFGIWRKQKRQESCLSPHSSSQM